MCALNFSTNSSTLVDVSSTSVLLENHLLIHVYGKSPLQVNGCTCFGGFFCPWAGKDFCRATGDTRLSIISEEDSYIAHSVVFNVKICCYIAEILPKQRKTWNSHSTINLIRCDLTQRKNIVCVIFREILGSTWMSHDKNLVWLLLNIRCFKIFFVSHWYVLPW